MEDFRHHILEVLNAAEAFAITKQKGLPSDSEEGVLLEAVGAYSAARIRAGSAAWQADVPNAVRQLTSALTKEGSPKNAPPAGDTVTCGPLTLMADMRGYLWTPVRGAGLGHDTFVRVLSRGAGARLWIESLKVSAPPAPTSQECADALYSAILLSPDPDVIQFREALGLSDALRLTESDTDLFALDDA